MLAFAMHLLENPGSSGEVRIHPDGEHAKIFEIAAFLETAGFHKAQSLGSTAYGGHYVRGNQTIIVRPASGFGDVVAMIDGRRVIAECKGGVINSNHAGQKSRLRKGLSELIGQLMILPSGDERQIAVLPETDEIHRLAKKLANRCHVAGIEIALVRADGTINYVLPMAVGLGLLDDA